MAKIYYKSSVIIYAVILCFTVYYGQSGKKKFTTNTNNNVHELVMDKEIIPTTTYIFDNRSSQYKESSSSVKNMLYGMVIIGGMLIYTLVSSPKYFNVPFLDFKASSVWLRWACPAILVYLWLHFGYTLYSSISSREFLLGLGQSIEATLPSSMTEEDPLKYAVEDGGIGDFIFYLLSPSYETTREPINTCFSWFVLIGMYSLLLGVVHGLIMSGIISWIKVTSATVTAAIYFMFTCIILLGSHLAFNTLVPDLWIFQSFICIFAMVTLYFLKPYADGRTGNQT